MKKLLLSTFYVLCVNIAYSQTAEVKSYNAEGFYLVDPETEYSYYPETYNLPNGSQILSYQWSVAPNSTTATAGTTNLSFYAKWRNTPNDGNNIKWIQVTVTYRYRSSPSANWIQSSVTSPQKPVSVKHIGIPTPLNINGSTYSNGNTHSLTCGNQSVSLSVPAVFTDPGAVVTYYWLYPPNWSGPATSTSPSVVATSSTNQGGQLTVEAKRNDSNFRTKITVNISRPLPSFGSLVVDYSNLTFCNPSETTLASATGTNADMFVWTPSANVRINGQTTPQTVSGPVLISAVGVGSFTVSPYSSACAIVGSGGDYAAVGYGTPPNFTIGGPDQICENQLYTNFGASGDNQGGRVVYEWSANLPSYGNMGRRGRYSCECLDLGTGYLYHYGYGTK